MTEGGYFEYQVWQSASGSLDVKADPKIWFAIVALEFAAFRGALVKLTADEPIADSTDVAIPRDAAVYDTDAFWSAGNPTRLTVPAGVAKVRLKGNIDGTFGGSGCLHLRARELRLVLWRRQGEREGHRRHRRHHHGGRAMVAKEQVSATPMPP